MSPIPSYGFGDPAPQCRSACAKGYYFCLAGADSSDDCSGGWAQCVARCNRPAT
jgi:hypothetical protein